MSETRIQITTLHDDGTAHMRSWSVPDGEEVFWADDIKAEYGDPDESVWTGDNVTALDHKTLPDDVIVFSGPDEE